MPTTDATVSVGINLEQFQGQFQAIEAQVAAILGKVGNQAEAAGHEIASTLEVSTEKAAQGAANSANKAGHKLLEGLREKFSEVGKLATGIFAGGMAFAGAQGMLSFGEKLLEKGQEELKIQGALTKAYVATGLTRAEAKAKINENAEAVEALKNKYLVEDEAVNKATTAYLAFGGSTDNLAEKQKTILGLSERLVAKGMDQEAAMQKAAVMVAKVGGEEAMGGLKMLGVNIDTSATAAERLAAMSAEGAKGLAGLQDSAENGAGAGMKRLKIMIDDIEKGIGEKLARAVAAFGNVLVGVFKFVEDNQGAMIALGVAVGALVIALNAGTISTSALGAAQALAAAKTVLLEGAQWALNVAMNANPVGLVVAALAALAAGLIYAYHHFTVVRATVDAVGAAFLSFWETIKAVAGGVAKVLHGVTHLDVGEIKEGLQEATVAVATSSANMAKAAAGAFSDAYKPAQEGVEGVKDATEKATEATKSWSEVVDQLAGAFDAALKGAKEKVAKGESALSQIVMEYEAKGLKGRAALRAAHNDERYKKELKEAREQAHNVAEAEAVAKRAKVEVEGEKDKKKGKSKAEQLRDEYKDAQAAQADALQADKLQAQLELNQHLITREAYAARIRELDRGNAEKLTAMAQDFERRATIEAGLNAKERQNLTAGFHKDALKERDAQAKAEQAIEDATYQAERSQAKAAHEAELAEVDAQVGRRELTQGQAAERRLELALAYDQAELAAAKAHGEKTLELEAKVDADLRAMQKNHLDRQAAFEKALQGIERQNQDKRLELMAEGSDREKAQEDERYRRELEDLRKNLQDQLDAQAYSAEQEALLRGQYAEAEALAAKSHADRLRNIQWKALEERTGMVGAANAVWQSMDNQLHGWLENRLEVSTKNQKTVLYQFEKAALDSLASFATAWLGKKAAMALADLVLGKTTAATAATATATSMAAISAAASPAATLTSIATFGGAALAGESAVLGALLATKGAASLTAFAKGGAIVGENGPELIFPAQVAVDYAASVAAAASRATERAIVNNGGGRQAEGLSARDVDRMVAAMERRRQEHVEVGISSRVERNFTGTELQAIVEADAVRSARHYLR